MTNININTIFICGKYLNWFSLELSQVSLESLSEKLRIPIWSISQNHYRLDSFCRSSTILYNFRRHKLRFRTNSLWICFHCEWKNSDTEARWILKKFQIQIQRIRSTNSVLYGKHWATKKKKKHYIVKFRPLAFWIEWLCCVARTFSRS